jgi:hypothetical protein
MRVSEINEAICIGDTVIDKMDDDAVRTISHFENHGDNTACVFMTDGGVMSLAEIIWNDEEPYLAPFRTHYPNLEALDNRGVTL